MTRQAAMGLCVALSAIALSALVACATAEVKDDAHDALNQPHDEVATPARLPDTIPPQPLNAGATPISAITWESSERVHIGYRDGTFVSANLTTANLEARHVGMSSFPIAALSPDGRTALIASRPLVIFDTESNQPILHFPDVKAFQAARFAFDGSFMVVAETDGRVHIWSRRQLTGGGRGEENLKGLLERQNPEQSTRFAPFVGGLGVTAQNDVVFADAQGQVFTWNIAQQQTFKVMKLAAKPRSVAGTGSHVLATSTEGELGVASINPPRFEKWSRQAHANAVAAHPDDPTVLVTVTDTAIALLDVKTGEPHWTRPIASGTFCGVNVARLGGPVALCLDNALVLLDPDDGHPTAILDLVDGQATWRDAAGTVVASPPKVAAPAPAKADAR